MNVHDPAVYMAMRGYPPTVVIVCDFCSGEFQAKDGVAFPGLTRSEDIAMAVYCSHACLLSNVPSEWFFTA